MCCDTLRRSSGQVSSRYIESVLNRFVGSSPEWIVMIAPTVQGEEKGVAFRYRWMNRFTPE
jgi:hypothetical protein